MNHQRFYNWSEQFHCDPQRVHRLSSETQAVELMNNIAKRDSHFRLFGMGLSPSDIAMSNEDLIVQDGFDQLLQLDRTACTVTVEPAITLENLSHSLAMQGLALPVLGSVAQQTVAGAVATATHGTGAAFGNLSTLVQAVRLVTTQGEVINISARENTGLLNAVRCHLGSLGILTRITLQVCPAFDLAVTEQPNTLEDVLANLSERLTSNDHYRFWYMPHTDDQVWEWAATRTPPGPSPAPPNPLQRIQTWFKEKLIDYYTYELLLYVATYYPSFIPIINRLGRRTRLNKSRRSQGPSMEQFTFDCLFKQHVNEWSIPVEHTAEALLELRDLIIRKGYYAHFPIEVRFVDEDDIWLSPCQGRTSCYIGVIAYMPHGRPAHHEAYFTDYERLMTKFGGRPHWAKFFRLSVADLADRYPYWKNFQEVRQHLDPDNRLRNTFTDRVLQA